MDKKLNWGILGNAKIARTRILPALVASNLANPYAIASRNVGSVSSIQDEFGIKKVYESYESLLEDQLIDVVYIPLPNHLHVEYAIKAMEAGKHVLCEKPIALTVSEMERLMDVAKATKRNIQEAFMVYTSPLWNKALQLVRSGGIGKIKRITGNFSYMNTDPANVRNRYVVGGGALFDVGCYLVLASRVFFGSEPVNAYGSMVIDEDFGVDILTSAVLEFDDGHALISCSTQNVGAQQLWLEGSTGRIRLQIPFSQPVDKPNLLLLDDGSDHSLMNHEVIDTGTYNQFLVHINDFSLSILENNEPTLNLDNSMGNIRTIEMIIKKSTKKTASTKS